MNRRIVLGILLFFILIILAAVGIVFLLIPATTQTSRSFDEQRAYRDVIYQLNLGPRTPGSQAHQQSVDWIFSELKKSGWSAEIQSGSMMGHPVQNLIGKRGSGKPWLIFGAHYDTRMLADQESDPAKRSQPVPGADDGASGVAVLLELARVLPVDLQSQVWLVFFDAEDQGSIPGWDWILGSRMLANSLTTPPDAVVVIDMIGDADLNIYKEQSSTPALVQSIWDTAAQAGYSQAFIPKFKYTMEDDHTPFLQRGFPAVDLIDFDYPYWHTTADTADKVSPASLKIVGETLIKWITSRKN